MRDCRCFRTNRTRRGWLRTDVGAGSTVKLGFDDDFRVMTAVCVHYYGAGLLVLA